MSPDGELAAVLRELVQFLECLRDVKLPATLEKIRESLLLRSKEGLTRFAARARPASPEPYLNMNAGSKGLHLAKAQVEAELQEYVGAEETTPEKEHDAYYETFQEVEVTSNAQIVLARPEEGRDRDDEDRDAESTLIEIYASLSAAQTKNKSHKCGPLYRKEGKKLFVFEQYRACWVGLVGSHLLVYGTDRDSRPCTIQPIRGYMARPAPNSIPRDQRRSGSAFEIFRPGSRTLQFVARTPKDMEQWVAKICQMGCGDKGETKDTSLEIPTTTPTKAQCEGSVSRVECRDDPTILEEERYQDACSLTVDKTPVEDPVATSVPGHGEGDAPRSSSRDDKVFLDEGANPPPLPARIPRRLPSLPHRGSASSYERSQDDADDEDDIYHKIEDYRGSAGTQYQNLGTPERRKNGGYKEERSTTYDDVRTSGKRESTYDDIGSVTMTEINAGAADENRADSTSYDDIENLLPSAKTLKTREKTEDATKSPQKKSFLDRVRSKKESPRKTEKKAKRKTPTPPVSPPTSPPVSPPSVSVEELPTYDDVSESTRIGGTKTAEEDLPEYNCPPPPRPIYVKPPALFEATEPQEFYDDVAAYRNTRVEKEEEKGDRRTTGKSNAPYSTRIEDDREAAVCENVEHYQIPRSGAPLDQQEELYDDIAILADFTARQRESFLNGKRDDDCDVKSSSSSSSSPEKKSWNRFVNARKPRSCESPGSEVNGRICERIEDTEECGEQHASTRKNTFQKLISKMENSLGKTSSRTVPSMQPSKTNVTNNA